MKNMTSNILLTRTAQEIEKSGFLKGSTGDVTGPTDIFGGLIRAKYAYVAKKRGEEFIPLLEGNDSRLNNAIVRGALKKIARLIGSNAQTLSLQVLDIGAWNDAPSRRKGQVVKLLRAAART
jgi:hypothetical protein